MKPTLEFFRETPADLESHPPLGSSLQTLETCFLLIALQRYPHALVACASAIESAIKAALPVPAGDLIKFGELVEKIGNRHRNLHFSLNTRLDEFRRARNQIAHYGFSPDDGSRSVDLLLSVGLPYLQKCYCELFSGFCLDWRDVRPGVEEFEDLTPDERAKAGLIPYLADHLRIASDVFRRARELVGIDLTYCFIAFGHKIRSRFKDRFTSSSEQAGLEMLFSEGSLFEREECEIEAAKREFKDVCWSFSCPVCGGPEVFIAELNESRLGSGHVKCSRAICIYCGLAVPKNAPYLTDHLVKEQVEGNRDYILKEFGITAGAKPSEAH